LVITFQQTVFLLKFILAVGCSSKHHTEMAVHLCTMYSNILLIFFQQLLVISKQSCTEVFSHAVST